MIMASYNIQGTFYEACDCEVICPCWAGVAPDMGSCTGLFAWKISHGTIDNVDVSGSNVVILSSGTSCDISKYMLVLVPQTHQELIANAFQSAGPWKEVFQAQSFDGVKPTIKPAEITIKYEPDNTISISATSSDPKVITTTELNFKLQPVKITGLGEDLLVDRVVGSAIDQSVHVGIVTSPLEPGQNGLNLLADTNAGAVDNYTFDVDVSRVSAMRGHFHYSSAG
jgi:Protein of unknown function (DUF1326)